MGAVNYKTSDYITLAIEPYNSWDLEQDNDFMEEAKEYVEEDGDIESYIYDYINICYERDYENASSILNADKYGVADGYFFHIAIKNGYYEGLSIDIENNFPVAFDEEEERTQALQEVDTIEKQLKELAGVGFVETFPHWITKYSDYPTTIEAIVEATNEMREEVKNTPTREEYEAVA